MIKRWAMKRWQQFQSWVRRRPRQAISLAVVLIVHICLIIAAAQHRTPPIPVISQVPVVVHTIQLKPPPKPVAVAPAPVQKTPPKPKPKAEPKPVAKAEPKAEPKPKPKPEAKPKQTAKADPKKTSKAPAKKPQQPTRQKATAAKPSSPPLFAEARELLKAMEKSDKPQQPAKAPLTAEQAAYTAELIAHLRLLMQLPHYGDLDVELTIRPDGTVFLVNVIRAGHQGNRSYVEQTLPSLKLPPYGSLFGSAPHHTFLLNLQNE